MGSRDQELRPDSISSSASKLLLEAAVAGEPGLQPLFKV